MTMGATIFAFVVMMAPASMGQTISESLCNLALQLGPLPARTTEAESPLMILQKVVNLTDYRVSSFKLIAVADDPRVRNNAKAQPCPMPKGNYIFYDPAFISATPSSSKNGASAYYVLAHETGHFIKDTFKPEIPWDEKEALADAWAGWAMEKLGFFTVWDVMVGVDYISEGAVDREIDTPYYHSRCHRRMDALEGFNKGAKGDEKLTYDSCLDCFPVSESGLYLGADIPAGTPLNQTLVHRCGRGNTSTDLPTDFSLDVRGACAVTRLTKGTELTWYNIGLCPGSQ